MRRTGRRHTITLRASVTAALTAVVLAGCSGALPTDPAPKAGLPVDVQPRQDVQRLLPRPQPGAGEAEIVGGFLRANVGFAEEDDVARDYLTTELASAWVPTSNVLVLEGNPQITSTEPGVVTVTAQVRGRIDEAGRLIEQPAGTVTTQSFDLRRVDGQWRISAFPEGFGLWLSQQDLDTSFRASTVYYLEPHLSVFVPDIRWLAHGEGRPTSLVRSQLAPVPPYLDGAVTTGASSDVRLTVGAVPVDPTSQLATVNVEGPGLSEDTARLRLLRAQLGHALLALNGVSAVDLRVSGRVTGLDEGKPATASTDLGYRDVERTVDRALLRLQDRFVVIDPTRYDLRNLSSGEPRSKDLPSLETSWTGVVSSADLSELAAVSEDGTKVWRWRGGKEETNTGVGDELTDPSYDPHGLVWVAGVSRGGDAARLWFSDVDDIRAVFKPLDVQILDKGDRIHAFRVSPDGARALLIVANEEEPDQQRLLVAGIVRNSAGKPTGLAQPFAVAPTLTEVASARWASTTEIVAAASRAEDPRLIAFRVPLGGWLRPLGTQVPGLVDVLPVPTGEGYSPVLRTDDGRFHTREGTTSWFSARNGDELVVPGG